MAGTESIGESFQLGNGFRLDSLNAVMRSRIFGRRSKRSANRQLSSSPCCFAHHSRGILSAISDSWSVVMLSAREGRFKVVPAFYVLIDVVAVINAMQGQVGKSPLTGIEVIAVINESGVIVAIICALGKNCLSSVAIASPLVEDKDPREIFNIEYSTRKRLRDIIKNVMGERVSYIPNRKLLPWPAKDAHSGRLNSKFRGALDEPFRNIYYSGFRHWKPKDSPEP